MIKRMTILFFSTVLFLLIPGCQQPSGPLTPPELSGEPYFRNEYLCLMWLNVHKGKEGFQGYNVYITTTAGFASLSPEDTFLKSTLVRARIGADQDTVSIKCTEMADENWLDDLDSFFVHIRSVAGDSVGEGGKEYLVYPEKCQVIRPPRNITYQIVADKEGNPGGAVKLSWQVPSSSLAPDGYIVYAQGFQVDFEDTVSATECTVYTPTDQIGVRALYGADPSNSESVYLGGEYWESVELYNIEETDTTLPNGFGFNPTTHEFELIALSETGKWPSIDLFLSTLNDLASPQIHEPALSVKNTMISENLVYGGFLGRDSVPAALSSNYISSRDIILSQSYAFWIDYTSNGYSPDDRFGKIEVKDLMGTRVLLNIAYQPIQGLRWVVLGTW